jgi:hypothetical protein
MKDRFVKVMLVIIAGLLLNCTNHEIQDSKQPPQNVKEFAIDKAKKFCEKFQWQCKDFKVDKYEQGVVSNADNANEIVEKWKLEISSIRWDSQANKWWDNHYNVWVKVMKNGDINEQ